MKRKIFNLSKFTIIIGLLFCFIFSQEYICSGSDSKTFLITMHYKRGVRFYKQGQYDKAIKEMERILEIEPKYTKAKKYLDASVKKKNKKIIDKLYKEAAIYFKKLEYQKSLDTYNKVLEIIPKDKFSLHRITILKDKIEKLKDSEQIKQYNLKKRTQALERFINKRKKRQDLLKEKAILKQLNKEEARQEKVIEALDKLELIEEVRMKQKRIIEKEINNLETIKQELLNKKLDQIPIKERTVNALFDDEIQGEGYEY